MAERTTIINLTEEEFVHPEIEAVQVAACRLFIGWG